MAEPRDPNGPRAAEVDFLVDENGSRVDVPDGSGIKVAGEHDATVGATGPTNWWLYGLIALAIIIFLLFVMQMFSGAPGTDMQPGTPTSEPVVTTPEADPVVDAPVVTTEPAADAPATSQ